MAPAGTWLPWKEVLELAAGPAYTDAAAVCVPASSPDVIHENHGRLLSLPLAPDFVAVTNLTSAALSVLHTSAHCGLRKT